MKSLTRSLLLLLSLALVATGCGDDDPDDTDTTSGDGDGDGDNEEEVITTLTLTFTPDGGGTAVVAEFDDPDGDGGGAPTIDAIALAADTTYTLEAIFTNKLANPAEDITAEVQDEAEEHQIFILGSSVSGPATSVAEGNALVTHAYADVESDYATNAEGEDLPVGLSNTITTVGTGTGGELQFVLRHLPPVNDTVVKTGTLASEVAAGGIASIAGDSDIDVTFDLSVE